MKVKILCHSCEGKGYIEEERYPDAVIIKVVCPECNGEKFVHGEEVEK